LWACLWSRTWVLQWHSFNLQNTGHWQRYLKGGYECAEHLKGTKGGEIYIYIIGKVGCLLQYNPLAENKLVLGFFIQPFHASRGKKRESGRV
jgi:hypothetical protein